MNSKLNRSPCNFRVEPVKNKLSLCTQGFSKDDAQTVRYAIRK